jgi:hypothetical protein
MLFKKKRSQPDPTKAATERRLHQKMHTLLVKAAAYLQQQASHFSVHTLSCLLITFCVLSGGASVVVVIGSMQEKQTPSFKIVPIRFSPNTLKTGEEHTRASNPVTKNEFQRIHLFRTYLDSLRQSSSGRYTHDRILYGRRALLDSIRQLETLFYLQQTLKTQSHGK